ncbi:phospholipase DDHD1 isoform X2 [Crotalus tigris]|uniref:phospholipase DDHD1 isoform X2 n=1 Tax=Crotalus tigris TaxID=88082 RepID=UPI00192F2581|nr:phospholipase DDHD1 isoform X2 [Crotalus tigris]
MDNPEAATNGSSSASNPTAACLGGFRKGARRMCDSEEKPLTDSKAAAKEQSPRPRSPQPPARLSSSGSEEAVPDHPEGPQHLPPPPPHRRPHHHHHHRRHHSPLNASPPQRRRRRRSNRLLLLDPGAAALMDAGGAAGLLYPPLGREDNGEEEDDDDDEKEDDDEDDDDDELDGAGDEEGAGDLASSESAGSGFSTQGCAVAERRKRARGSGSGLSGGGISASSCISRNYEVVRELGAEEVRWFYREDRKGWKPFIGYDSLRIELAYRALLVVDDQGSSSPTGGPEKLAPSSSILTHEPVCVRGGLYEVDVVHFECYPVYWNQSEKIPVMRGQWFIDGTWQPLEEEESNLIEQEHLRCFKGQQMQNFDTNVSKPIDRKEAVHSLKLSRNHVDWHSVDEVYLYSDATTSKIARTVSQKLGFSKASSSGTRLHRGYVEEATLEDKPSPTTHIVFVVHGIGQKIEQGRIIRNTAMMRETARKIEDKYFSNLATHVEFLPVEWRSKLILDGDTVDSITPDKVRGLRDLLNSSAMDIMYYTSPLYRDELVKGLQQEMNRLYTLFCSRNPEFTGKKGKVSIVSHSLGCVITYDIMTGWNPVRLYEQLLEKEYDILEHSWMTYEEQHLLEEFYLTKKQLREIEDRLHGLKTSTVAETPALKFKVDNFFCMGSPLAVFLALRGIRPGNSGTQDHILPRKICNRLLNIFHPTDPVAYRLEPLILKHYSNISPVQIHWYNTTNPLPYEHMKPSFLNLTKESTSVSDPESLTTLPSPTTSPVMSRRHYGESITNIGKASILGAASIGKGLGGMLFSRFGRSNLPTSQVPEPGKEVTEVEDKKPVLSQTSVGTQTFPHSSSGFLDPTIELDHRIDFELREGLVESRYWSAVTSHTAYWSSMDVALFLLTFMYKQDQGEDNIKPHLDPV